MEIGTEIGMMTVINLRAGGYALRPSRPGAVPAPLAFAPN